MSTDEKTQLRQLFEKYDKKQTDLQATKSKLTKLTEERSDILQQISDLQGPGPYNYNGQVVKIVKRGNTLFFRGKGEKEVIEV